MSEPCLVLQPDAPRFTVLAASDAYLSMAGMSREDCVGRGLFESTGRRPPWLGEPELGALHRSLDQALATRAPTRLLLEAGGSVSLADLAPQAAAGPRWSVVNTPIGSDDAAVRYLLHRIDPVGPVQHDVGERADAPDLERKLAARTRDLENVLAELEAFSYSVSHDLRAPLRAIDGFAQALLHDYAAVLDAGAQRYLDRVRAGAQRMSDLIDDMLSLSRLQRTPLRKSRIDVSEVAQRIIQGLEQQNPERRVEVEVAPGLFMYGDPHLVGVVIEQLLGNAWKFTAKKAPAKIRIGGTPEAPPTIFIADDGAGFDMSYASRLFSPFQRLHKASDFEGTGIGLAIAQRIVARHGGRIWAEAEVGKGAKFSFYLGDGEE